MRVYLVRHGETEWNAASRLQGSSDVPLHANGRRQAREAAALLDSVVAPGALIVSSPLSRARDTAQALAERRDVDVAEDRRVIERAYGVWEGVTSEERSRRWPDAVERWRRGGDPGIEGFETHDVVAERMVTALEEWADLATSDLVVFAHGSCARVGILALLGLSLDHRWVGNLGNCAWARLERHSRGDWTLERHNVTVRTYGATA